MNGTSFIIFELNKSTLQIMRISRLLLQISWLSCWDINPSLFEVSNFDVYISSNSFEADSLYLYD